MLSYPVRRTVRYAVCCLACLLCAGLARPAAAQEATLRPAGPATPVLSANAPAYSHARWSPDGRHLAFTAPGYAGLWVHTLADGTTRQVTDAPAAGFGFSWSPDGQALLARTARYDGPRRSDAVMLFDLAAETTIPLTDYRAQLPALPQWTPDGAAAVLALPSGVEVLPTGRAAKQAAPGPTFAVAGGDAVRVDEAGTATRLTALAETQVLHLVPSPDGRRLIVEPLGGPLFVVDADGGNRTVLGQGHRPRWSPDGQWVVFMRTRDDGHHFTAADLFAARADGSAVVQLTDTPDRLEMNPDWSPDGRTLVFDALDEGLFLLPLAR